MAVWGHVECHSQAGDGYQEEGILKGGHGSFMGIHLIEATLLLLFLTTIAVPWASRTGLPTEILLVLGSLALSLLPGLPPLILDPAVVFTLFLPPILFSAAYFTSWRDFKQNRRPVFLLAFGESGGTTRSGNRRNLVAWAHLGNAFKMTSVKSSCGVLSAAKSRI